MNSKHLTMKLFTFSAGLLLLLLTGCQTHSGQGPRFKLLRKDATGLDFHNELHASSEFNVFNYMYFFNGGGVAAADFNQDGLVDLFFTNNMGPNKLFLNEGGLKFKDVTQAAGMAGREGWTSGTSVVDINNDGMPDIYVGQMGDFQGIRGQNQLYVCQRIENGIPVFEDEAIPYGLDLVGFATQAAFFDYDLDGDLDMFQMNNSLHANGTFGQKKTFTGTRHPLAGDRLMRNDGDHFTEVTVEAGINSTVIGYGLGIVTGDVNLDGWPDIYIGNDFHENDYLYINQHDGTFKEVLTEQMMHTSRFSMGVDMADINNDGWNDIISLDMLPEDPYILKTSLGEDELGVFRFKLYYGYNHQFARNNLQLNNGDGTFSEIGMFAGVHATDWSWAPLFMDFDDDGYKDLFISNGIPRRMNDIDYVNFRANNDLRWKASSNNLEESDLRFEDKMPQIKLPNKFYLNNGHLQFTDISNQVTNDENTFSNGAIYADLDNDGDLDVVVNNQEDEPFVYQNTKVEKGLAAGSHLTLSLKGPPANINAIGARVFVFKGPQEIVYEHYPVRGFQSSVLSSLHIGVGDTTTIDSIIVIWPDNSWQRLENPVFNSTAEVAWRPGLPSYSFDRMGYPSPHRFNFSDITARTGLDFTHHENPFVEFDREFLIPHMVSTEGPAVAVGDLNGDGLDDVFFGGAKRHRSAVYFQQPNGRFTPGPPEVFRRDSLFEDVDAVLADIENDGDLDIVVAAGGNEFRDTLEPMKQRYYLNDGKGNFERRDFKGVFMTAACVLPADYNKDGLTDFFFGARALPWNYGLTPSSSLLLNKGNGEFEDVALHDDALRQAGLVKSGTWYDMDGDGDKDLVLAIEWEPLTVFLNNDGHFEKHPLNDKTGWWNFVLPRDFDGDGDVDLLAGNLGENAKFKPTPDKPVRMYVNDFDENGQVEQILTYYLGGKEIPFANYAELTKQLPKLGEKYPLSKDFAKASLAELFGGKKLKNSVVREVNTLQSIYFENTGHGLEFLAHDLPAELQFSTLQATRYDDFDGDGKKEIMLGGNFYDANIEMGRYDANYGNVLSISKEGKMDVFPLGDLRVKGQVRRIRPVTIAGKTCYILAKNNDVPQVIQPGTNVQKLTKN